MELRQGCHASQRAIKSYSVRQTRYHGVIRVSFFRFFRFFGAQSGQTRRLAEVGPSPRRPDLTRLSRPFFFDAPPGTNGRCLWPDLQFPVNKSLAVERYTRAESNWATPRRAAPRRAGSTSVTTTKRRVIAGASVGDERFSRSGGKFVSNVITHVVVRSTDSSSFFSPWRRRRCRRRDARINFPLASARALPDGELKTVGSRWLPIIHRIQKTARKQSPQF